MPAICNLSVTEEGDFDIVQEDKTACSFFEKAKPIYQIAIGNTVEDSYLNHVCSKCRHYSEI